MGEGLDLDSFFFLQYLRGKISYSDSAPSFSSVSNLITVTLIPINSNFAYFMITDLVIFVSMVSLSIFQAGVCQIAVTLNGADIIVKQKYVTPSTIHPFEFEMIEKGIAGYTLLANGINTVKISVDLDFAINTNYLDQVTTSVIRGVYMND